jgi:hypothetical protein
MEVHPPDKPIHSWKDFLIHLATITIGLLIAVGIEGIVEWRHHVHLVNEAEAGLNEEITRNAAMLPSIRKQIAEAQKVLSQDMDVLHAVLKDPHNSHQSMSLSFTLHSFDNVSWRSAQATGAFTYMPLEDARQFSDIYETQEEIFRVEQQEVDDVLQAASLVFDKPTPADLSPQTIVLMAPRIGLIQMRLNLLDSLLTSLDRTYHAYEGRHPGMA